MPRGNCTFRQGDLKKMLKAYMDAGIPVARSEVDRDGKIIVIAGPPEPSANLPKVDESENEFGD